MEKNDLLVFPIKTIPSSITESKKYHFRVGDFLDDKHINEILWMMFEESECGFFYFGEQGMAVDPAFDKAKENGDLLISETQFYWYLHPKAIDYKDFTHIEKKDSDYAWEWQKETVEKGPMFMRMELKLSNKKRTEFEIWKKIHLEQSYRDQIRRQKYSYDVFLSYGARDSELAQQIYNEILSAGGKVFLAKKNIEPGSDFALEIRNALKESLEVWILVSPNSVKSEWVISEWGAAWVLGKKIIPILFRCAPESLPIRLQRLQCIDFHKYQNLVKDLFSESKIKNGG